jgi:hypothetical protein
MVAIPEVASNAPDTAYNVANFKYDYQNDCYTCPQGQVLNFEIFNHVMILRVA